MIIPAYNAARYIGDTINSVLVQTLAPVRVIVVNDGSTDRTAEIVEEIISEYKGSIRIELYNKPNGGQSTARNLGIEKSTAPFLAFLDADDLWHPKKLEQQMKLFDQGSVDLGLAYCGHQVIDENGVPLPLSHNKAEMPNGRIFERMLMANLINASATAALVRRECFTKLGTFDETLRGTEDWDMWLRISEHYSIDRVLDPLVSIRHHSGSAQADVFGMLKGTLALYIKWFPSARDRPEVMKLWGHLLGEFVLRSKDPDNAQKHVEKHLSSEMKAAFFRRTFGSFKLYLKLKRMRKSING